MEPLSEALILRVDGDTVEETLDEVAAETTVNLSVNGEFLVSLLCTPSELDAMAVGFLLSEGIISEPGSFSSVTVAEESSSVDVRVRELPQNWEDRFRKATVSSGCGAGVTFTGPGNLTKIQGGGRNMLVSRQTLGRLLRDFREMSDLYRKTGGVHSAALAENSGIVLFSEDIGRHNAVDKLVGKAFLRKIPVDDKIVLSSGRVSGEIMTKIVRNRIPMLVSRAAPTCMSVTVAEDHGVTLIGFARGKRMNIYSHPWRVDV